MHFSLLLNSLLIISNTDMYVVLSSLAETIDIESLYSLVDFVAVMVAYCRHLS